MKKKNKRIPRFFIKKITTTRNGEKDLRYVSNSARASKERAIREPLNLGGITKKDMKFMIENDLSKLAVCIRNGNVDEFNLLASKLVREEYYIRFCLSNLLSNKGIRTPGYNDKSRPTTNKEYDYLVRIALYDIKYPIFYKANPLIRFYIDKASGGKRPISVPSYKDRLIQMAYKYIMEIAYEEVAEPNSFGFRPYRSTGWAAKAMSLSIQGRHGYGCPKYAIEIDIEKYFDTISHEYILNELCEFKHKDKVFKLVPKPTMQQWLKSGFIEKESKDYSKIFPTEYGVPQGGIISPVISNFALNGIEKEIFMRIKATNDKYKPTPKPDTTKLRWQYFYKNMPAFIIEPNTPNREILEKMKTFLLGVEPPRNLPANLRRLSTTPRKSLHGWSIKEMGTKMFSTYVDKIRRRNQFFWYFIARFADDNRVLCNRMCIAKLILRTFRDFGAKRGFRINDRKTEIKEIAKEGFNFVGFHFSVIIKRTHHRIYYYPSNETVHNALEKVKKILAANRNPEIAFRKCNSFLIGWLYYYSTSNAKNIFIKMSYKIWHIVYRYFVNLYKNHKGFKCNSRNNYKRKLAAAIYDWHLCSYKDTKWWYINKLYRKDKRYAGKQNLFLTYPSKFSIIYPKIICLRNDKTDDFLGLSAYHPDDYPKLRDAALQWKVGLYKKVLKKTKGLCYLCEKDLLRFPYFELHHTTPLTNLRAHSIKYLIPLCKTCHSRATAAAASKNKTEFLRLKSFGVFVDAPDEWDNKGV